MSSLLLLPDGAESPVPITVDRADARREDVWHLAFGDTRADVELRSLHEQGGVLRINGRVVTFHATRNNDVVEIWLNGRRYLIRPVDRTAQRTGSTEHSGVETDITAAMPGTVLKINVRPGDRFEAHAPLIVMESMKMEMTLSAPVAGRVREVLCRAGELVSMGKVLLQIEPGAASDRCE